MQKICFGSRPVAPSPKTETRFNPPSGRSANRLLTGCKSRNRAPTCLVYDTDESRLNMPAAGSSRLKVLSAGYVYSPALVVLLGPGPGRSQGPADTFHVPGLSERNTGVSSGRAGRTFLRYVYVKERLSIYLRQIMETLAPTVQDRPGLRFRPPARRRRCLPRLIKAPAGRRPAGRGREGDSTRRRAANRREGKLTGRRARRIRRPV